MRGGHINARMLPTLTHRKNMIEGYAFWNRIFERRVNGLATYPTNIIIPLIDLVWSKALIPDAKSFRALFMTTPGFPRTPDGHANPARKNFFMVFKGTLPRTKNSRVIMLSKIFFFAKFTK
jgi:hypothetical protein